MGGQVAETDKHQETGALAQGKARRKEIEAGHEVVLRLTGAMLVIASTGSLRR